MNTRCLHHELRDVCPSLVGASLELSVNLVRCHAFFSKVVYVRLKARVTIDDFAVSNQELGIIMVRAPVEQ